MFYEEVLRKLNKEEIRYLVVGGIALNLHGVPRTTMDLDLMVDLSKKNLSKLTNVLKSLGYEPKTPNKAADLLDEEKRKMWIRDKNMLAFCFIDPKKPYKQVDIFIDNPIDFEKADQARNDINAEGLVLPLISLDNLIQLKEKSSRKQDISDVEALKQIKEIENNE
ncbi:hypothetical protein LCGC14_0739090 [marine sediment metagenome]|uniref:Uncharacterized protein n=1 Tax=marine sediment metagenome TaxID=412755 RepID=A0A0F9QSD5_9ZZZZ